MPDFAVDYSYARPDPAQMAATGYRAAGRYLSDEPGKNLTISERDRLFDAGLAIFLVWETTGNMVLRGAAGAIADVRQANAQADALGWPLTRPIHYAIDFEPTISQLHGPILDYFVAARTNSARPVAPYGCAAAVDFLCGPVGIYPTGWQCLAWSYGRISDHAALYQAPNWQQLTNPFGNSIDENEIRCPDFGQWHPDLPTASATTEGDWLEMATQQEVEAAVTAALDAHGFDELKLAVQTVQELSGKIDQLAQGNLTLAVNIVDQVKQLLADKPAA